MIDNFADKVTVTPTALSINEIEDSAYQELHEFITTSLEYNKERVLNQYTKYIEFRKKYGLFVDEQTSLLPLINKENEG